MYIHIYVRTFIILRYVDICSVINTAANHMYIPMPSNVKTITPTSAPSIMATTAPVGSPSSDCSLIVLVGSTVEGDIVVNSSGGVVNILVGVTDITITARKHFQLHNLQL